MAAHYGDYATAGDAEKTDDLAADTGGVFRRGLKKVAAYRTLTASCTNARPYALTSATSCAGITQKRPGIVSVTALASTHTEKFSTDRRTLHWDLLNKEADFRGRQVVRDQTARIKGTR